jgi:hypothetical protein
MLRGLEYLTNHNAVADGGPYHRFGKVSRGILQLFAHFEMEHQYLPGREREKRESQGIMS